MQTRNQYFNTLGKKLFFSHNITFQEQEHIQEHIQDSRTYDKTSKIPFGQGDVCTTGCLLDYNYFKNYYRLIAKDLGK